MTKSSKALSFLQKLGKSLMVPVAVLPAAGLLARLGASDMFNWPWMAAGGGAILDNLPLIFAIGIAVGLADENNGVAALAATVGYYVLTRVATSVATSFNPKADVNMGVLAGIIAGILAAHLYNKYKAIKLPDYLGFFGGRRFVPIVTSFYTLLGGIAAGFIWPPIQDAITAFGNALVNLGAFGAGMFGFLNRLLLPFGLHHVVNTVFWQQVGTFTNSAGKVFMGDYNRFLAGDPHAGTYLTGFFPIMMFALPAACLAMIKTSKKANQKAVAGLLLSAAFTSFLTGVTEPIEFSFMFLAPGLYAIHAVLTGASLAVTNLLGMRSGFSFSAGALDFFLNWGISSKPLLILLTGIIFGIIYYFVFVFFIEKFNIPTPGRLDDEVSTALVGLSNAELKGKAAEILDAIGGKPNIDSIDACVTRIRLTAIDGAKVDEAKLKKIGATGIMKMGSNNFQIVVGTVADPLTSHIKDLMRGR